MVDIFVYGYRVAQPRDINLRSFFRIHAYPYVHMFAEAR